MRSRQQREESVVIARVEILEVHIRELPGLRSFHVVRARVVQSVRGTADRQIVEIYAEPTSCGGGLDQRAVGRKGFIGGRFHPIADETFFERAGTLTGSHSLGVGAPAVGVKT